MAPAGITIFPKGPNFTLENFSSKDFLVQDFIESLSESALPANRRSAPASQAAFDPKPFIRTFEHALARLASLSEDLASRETELLAGVRRAELQHSQTIDSLGRQLDQTLDSFQRFDTSLGHPIKGIDDEATLDAGGNAAVRIGEKLEELDRQSRRALDAKFLIQCWMEVTETGQLSALERLRQRGSGDGKVRCAVLAKQLMRISQRLDPGNWRQAPGDGRIGHAVNGVNGSAHGHNTREAIEKFAETLEKDLLAQFDASYRKQDFEGMRNCANVLYDFNGGANVIATFVNQHQFFIDRRQLITEEVDSDLATWERVSDPDQPPPKAEASLQALIDEVKLVTQEESFIIKRAFPYHELVLTKFIQRVFQQSIQQRLEMVLAKAETSSPLAFLRSLQAAKSSISTMVDDLKAHGLTEHPDQVSLQISLVLDQQVDELFVPYLVGSSYIEREKRTLEEIYSSLLFKFNTYHARRKKAPTTFMATLAKSGSELLASARDAYMDRLDSSDLTPSQKAMLLRIAGLKDAEGTQTKGDAELSETDGLLSVDNAKRMLRWLAESVGRSLELTGGGETPKDVLALLNVLLANMGEQYVEMALEAAIYSASSQESAKTEPDVSYLPQLRPAIVTMHLLTACVNTVLLPLAASNLSIRRQIEKRTSIAVSRAEERVNSVMQHTVDVILAWTSRLLQGQKKADFRPKDGALEGPGGWLEMLQTPTCLGLCTFLAKVGDALAQAIDGRNLALFSTEVATGVRAQLLEHFRRFVVSATGGLMVAKDLARYAAALRALPAVDTAAFAPSLDVLAEIGNLFVIGPDALRERVRGGGGGGAGGLELLGVDKAALKPYIQRREDAGSVAVQSILNSM